MLNGQGVHRLVYLTFIEEIDEYDLIHHKDEDKLNNHVDNLEKQTRSEHKITHLEIGGDTRFKVKYKFNP